MFSLKIEKDTLDGTVYYDVALEVKCAGVALLFSPEFPQAILDVDVEASTGVIDTRPSNGTFELSWDYAIISLSCSRHGDGRGGSLTVLLPQKPEVMESLRTALRQWKAVFAGQ